MQIKVPELRSKLNQEDGNYRMMQKSFGNIVKASKSVQMAMAELDPILLKLSPSSMPTVKTMFEEACKNFKFVSDAFKTCVRVEDRETTYLA